MRFVKALLTVAISNKNRRSHLVGMNVESLERSRTSNYRFQVQTPYQSDGFTQLDNDLSGSHSAALGVSNVNQGVLFDWNQLLKEGPV